MASNLRYGRPDATDDELWEALRIAQAEDFVRDMPDQLDATIAQGGTNVSGGQRQRLSIARALIKKPEVYVFDDSFSALDVATDARLRAALKRETRGAAVIIVGQRVATIADADKIIVLEHGEIVGSGTHDELLRELPDLRRDRRFPAERRGGRSMSRDQRGGASRGRARRPSARSTARAAAVGGFGGRGWRRSHSTSCLDEEAPRAPAPERMILIAVVALAVVGI